MQESTYYPVQFTSSPISNIQAEEKLILSSLQVEVVKDREEVYAIQSSIENHIPALPWRESAKIDKLFSKKL